MILKVLLVVLASHSVLIGNSECGVAVAHASHIHGKEGTHKERVADGAYSPRDAHHHVSYIRSKLAESGLTKTIVLFQLTEWRATRLVLWSRSYYWLGKRSSRIRQSVSEGGQGEVDSFSRWELDGLYLCCNPIRHLTLLKNALTFTNPGVRR